MSEMFANDSLLNLENGHYISVSAIESFQDYLSLDKEFLECKKQENKFSDFCVTEKGVHKKPFAAIITKNERLILVCLKPTTLAARIAMLNATHYNNLKLIFKGGD